MGVKEGRKGRGGRDGEEGKRRDARERDEVAWAGHREEGKKNNRENKDMCE